METIESTQAVGVSCKKCKATLLADEKFCGYCGCEVQESEKSPGDAFEVLSPTLIFYFITLILLGIYKLTDAFPDGIEGLVLVSIIDVAIVIFFWVVFFKDLKPLFSFKRVTVPIVFLVLAASVFAGILVSLIASYINFALHDDVYYSPYLFRDTSNPLLWAVFMTCVQPAIFEEVAFRGFLFSNVQRLTTPMTALYVTSFLFGVMHLSIISLIWLVPLGLVFAWLRIKYQTLWYGVFAHFTYNLTVTLIEIYF